jgi:hypothetical protein
MRRTTMTTTNTQRSVSRRTALAGLGGGGLGLDLAATAGAAAQDATPFPMAGHPLVGAWIVDRNPADPSDLPTHNVFTADGGVIEPTVGGAGVWEATGPDTANWTMTGTIAELGAYFVVRGTLVVDAGGDTATASVSSTIVAADGTTMDELTVAQVTARYLRNRIEPQDAVGQPLAGFPAWTPAPPATPTT